MTLPNFFIVGASKSGTTSLYHYLKQHPEIYMCPDKEPQFYRYANGLPEIGSRNAIMSAEHWQWLNSRKFPNSEEYQMLFEGVTKEKAIGEASTPYLISNEAPVNISQAVPHAKIIIILRNPFDAAYSEFCMDRRENKYQNKASFLEVLQAEDLEDMSLEHFPRLIRTRFYDAHIERYLEYFPRNQISFHLMEDLSVTDHLFLEIFKFLEVSPDFKIDDTYRHNAGHAQKINLFHLNILKLPDFMKKGIKMLLPNFIRQLYWNKLLAVDTKKLPVKCPEVEKEFLRPIFTPRIQRLQDLIDRDLSMWLE